MKSIDSRMTFPNKDKSAIDKTMTIVNNVSELLEGARKQNKRLYTYRDKEIKKVTPSDNDDNQKMFGDDFIAEDPQDSDDAQDEGEIHLDVSKPLIEKKYETSKEIVMDKTEQSDAKKKSRTNNSLKNAEQEKELNVKSFKNNLSKSDDNMKNKKEDNKEKTKENLENLNQSSISEIKEQYSIHHYSEDDEKDTQNMLIEQAHKEQFEEFSRITKDLIADKITERFKDYEALLDDRIRSAVVMVRSEIKE